MQDPSLRASGFFLKNSVLKTEDIFRRRGIRITSGKILAEQTFGFWLALFLPHHYRLLAGQPIHIFPYKPTTENRASIYSKLNHIRAFRNRINHSEPICFSGQSVSCQTALETRLKLFGLISWIDPGLTQFLSKLDNIPNKANHILLI